MRTLTQSFLAALALSACLCGREISGDSLDGGVHRDAGLDGGDAGLDGGDSGIDCSMTCLIGGAQYCANEVNPADSCYGCVPEESASGWTALSVGTACRMQSVEPGDLSIGACWLPPVGSTEYCECAINSSPCWAPTACCQGACRDAGNGPFCFGVQGNQCSSRIPCWQGTCCLTPDGGGYGTCSSDDGTCPG